MTTLMINIENEEAYSKVTDFLKTIDGVSYNQHYEYDEPLEAELDEAEKDSKAGRVFSHQEVMAEAKARFKL